MKSFALVFGLAMVVGWICGCGSNSGQQTTSASQNTSPPGPNILKGQYAFMLSGADAVGNPMGIVGSIAADGLGHITGGSIVVNDNFAVSSNSAALTGTYSLDNNERGTITLTNTVGSVAQSLAFAFTLRADGTSGSLIGIGSNNFIIVGTLQRQDTTAFSLAALATGSSSFLFEIDSNVPSRSSTIGRFTLNATGTNTSGLFDVSVAGTGPTTVGGSLSVTLAAGGPDASGGGSLSLSENGIATNYVYFIANAGRFVLMQTDTNVPNTLGTGVAEAQNLPFTAATANTTGSIFALTGFDSARANYVSTVGRVQIASSNAATLLWDTDDAGTVFSQKSLIGATVTFDGNTGRGTILSAGGSSAGLFDQAVFYLSSSGNGFLLDTSAGQLNRALAGRLQSQASGGTFSGTMLSGLTIERHLGHNSAFTTDQTAEEALFSDAFNSGNNSLSGTGTGDFWTRSGSSGLNRTFSIGEGISIDTNTGRGTLTFATSTSPANLNVFYVIGPDDYVLIDETQPPQNDIPIQFFDPEQ